MRKKTISALCLITVAATALIIPMANGKIKPYYKGDAISYNDKIVISTTNTSALEIFKVEGKNVVRTAKIISFRWRYSGYDSYYDSILNIENNVLYVYAVDGAYIYKYDLTNLNNPRLVAQVKDNSYDWFTGLTKMNGKIATIGTNGIKIWDKNMVNIDSFKVYGSKNTYNVSFSQNGNYIIQLSSSTVSVFDTRSRAVVSTYNVRDIKENHNRKIFNDDGDGSIYVAGDGNLEKLSISGNVLQKFDHISNLGYDVVGSSDRNYVYFSDGIGVVKVRRSDFKAVDWAYTGSMGAKDSWAMGLRKAATSKGDYLVIFNNSNILVLDQNMNKVGSFAAYEEEDKKPAITESLHLSVDKNHAAANSQVLLSGGGYGANEDLVITFAKSVNYATANEDGRFSTIITVPSVLPGGNDIKVVGKITGLSYSIGFQIE